MKNIFISIFLLLIIVHVAQSQVTVEFKITKLGTNYTDGSSNGSRFRFYANSTSGSTIFIPGNGSCIKRNEKFESNESIVFSVYWANTNAPYKLILVTHNERKDGSGDCTAEDISDVSFRKPDLHEKSTEKAITYASLQPGVFVPIGRMQNDHEGTWAYADVSIRIPVSKPSSPTITHAPSGSTTTFCSNSEVDISTTVAPNNTGLTYTWEYAFPSEDRTIQNPDRDPRNYYDDEYGCGYWEMDYSSIDPETGGPYRYWVYGYDCDLPTYITVSNWRPLTLNSSAGASGKFTPQTLFAKAITTAEKVYFRVTAKSADGVESKPSDASTYTFLPPPPTVNTSLVQIKPSCYSENNGKITIPKDAITSQFSTIRWLLRNGSATQPCSMANGDCGTADKGSSGAVPYDNGIIIEGIGAGSYTLWIMNPGEDAGNCYQPIPVTVTQLSELQIANTSNNNVSCYGGSDGVINVSASGSDAASGYYFILKKQDGTIVANEQRSSGNTMQWTGLPAGNYRAELRDGACATTVKSVNIALAQPPQITGEATITQPNCQNPGNGSIAVAASEGVASYNYILNKNGATIAQSGNTVNRNYSFNSLGSGDYTVVIQNADYAGCIGWSTNVTLTAVAPLTLSVSGSDPVSCNGGSDGRMQLAATGGSGSYQYALAGSNGNTITNTTGLFTDLAAGDYQVTVTNYTAGCNDGLTQTITVYQRDPLQVQLQKTDVTCNAANDAVIEATASGGSGSYRYNWQQYKNGDWQSNSFWFNTDTKIEGLEPGTYRVIVSDANAANCNITSSTLVVTEPQPLQIEKVSTTEAVCKADGARMNVTASGGNGNYIYAYSLDGGSSFTPFTGTTPLHTTGEYTVQVSDARGCKAQDATTYNIVLPATALDFTATLSDYNGFNISCSGQTDGQIQINASGGNDGGYSGYQYKLNDGDYQNNPAFDNLAAGNYIVTIKDGRGCEVSKTITLYQPTVKLAVTQTDINCYGEATGSLLISAAGGAAPYTLTINGAAATMGQLISNLAQGSYSIRVQDANNCTKDTVVTIEYIFAAIVPDLTVNNIRCYGNRGNAVISATGGDGNYSFTVSANNWQTQSNWLNTDSLTEGAYRFKVSDGTGCTVEVPGTVQITAPLEPLDFTSALSDYNGYNVSCFGGNNGFAQLTATGGNGNNYSGYTYALNNNAFESSSLLQGIVAGDHILKVQDARGCTVEKPVTFTQAVTLLSITLVNRQNTACANTATGVITVAGNGGSGSLVYSIDGSNWQQAPTFSNLAAADYTVLVKDINDCTKSISATVGSDNPAIVIDNIIRNDIVCYGGTGGLLVTKHGGTGALTQEYALNGNAYSSFTKTTPFSAGNYTVRIKDEAGCYSDISDIISITTPSEPLSFAATLSNYNGSQISCYGKNDGSIQLAASGGNGGVYSGYQYSVNNSAYSNLDQYQSMTAGSYDVKLKDGRGCIVQDNLVLQQPAAPLAFEVAQLEHLVCGGSPTGKIVLQAATGGTSPYQYRLNNQAWQSDVSFTALFAGSYTLQVKDANDCIAEKTVAVNTQYPAITATATIKAVRCYGESNGSIQVAISGGSGNYTYQWNNTPAPEPVLENATAGTYQLRITDGVGCTNSYDYTITQPQPLTMQVDAPAICDDYSNGTITVFAAGGTAPYQYAFNNQAGQPANSFNNLTPGLYNVTVTDANGCTIAGSTTIGKLNTKPDVNFLVATRKNALDTLAIKEISLPAPDNVAWSFHPDANWVGQQNSMPLIKFNAPGNYWAEMTGQWGACTYTLKKDIIINPYDPLAGPGYSIPARIIDTVMLSPNPNDGNFRLQVKLNRKQQAAVYIYHISSAVIEKRQYAAALLIDDRFGIANNYGSGTYLLRVVTENDSRDVKFIITR